jgi:osmotically-inducible protein OsmY
LIGEQHRGGVEGVGEQQEEVEQRIRTRIGEDPRTADMPRVNVEVNDGVAELRGAAPSEEARQAAGEIAQESEGVREVRNLITVS